jgi:hypothetical protein
MANLCDTVGGTWIFITANSEDILDCYVFFQGFFLQK